MSYRDKSLTCSDCASHFAFSAGDQRLSAELGFVQPVRCETCRSSRESSRRQFGRDTSPAISRLIPALALVRPVDIPL